MFTIGRILALLVLTVVAFWPMNAALWYHGIASPRDRLTDPEAARMAARWVRLDWLRAAGAAIAFITALVALTRPWPQQVAPQDPPLVRLLLAAALAGVAAFAVWFVASL